MCEAEQYFEKLKTEFGYTDEEAHSQFSFCCYECNFGVHGFIFRDGSVLEIGIGEDHRIVDVDDWYRLNLVTYTITHGEGNARVHGYANYVQIETLYNMCIFQNVEKLYVDVYDEHAKYLGSLEFDYLPELSPCELHAVIMRKLQS